MSVIGRMDGQVDEVLIKPIGKRNRPVDEERPRASEELMDEAPREAQKDVPEPEEPLRSPSTELPVWLL